ncbi:TonB-dependent receptor [Steroidobacter agaridevorans]|uniref:TonB-dependent receptor n=1 Tax=Steroidobacter agaridevorans TaxID=2695856 RepID=A0A829Y9Y2_9GAMM|nr:TonB-dependent receptor [Steroidobacter agaridevorans]GFE80154.1 TonB-dependent receptor [Steroidobacter agaridevorans]
MLRCSLAAAALALPLATLAQSTTENAPGSLLEEVLVTATKSAQAEAIQDVPLTLTAFGAEQLDALFVKDLHSLSFQMPNVALDDIGTIKGTANFTIRGLGINSSIPSIDPTVGVFVDGMYLGIIGGVVFDLFDLEGIEVLRGPQGLLFGRNVTGGAVLVRTRKPSQDFEADFKLSTTDEQDSIAGASISGPLIAERLAARLTAYYNDDQGWFTNLADGEDFGQSKTWLVRPSLSWTPTDGSELLLRYEHGDITGDGPAGQNRALYARDSFDFQMNYDGYSDVQWDQAIAELNIDVSFGDGVITNILGRRDYTGGSGTDVDATINTAFHSRTLTEQDQLSEELRYAGSFGRVKLTTGLYWFTQDLTYFENRILSGGAVNATMGGEQSHDAYGVFAQTDIALTDAWVLTLGARYSREEKDALIATFVPSTARSVCSFEGQTCTFDFRDSHEWSDTTPKVGLQWRVSDDAQLYTFWTKGFRSGGYNLRSTTTTATPGPTDPEKQDAYELGAKVDWLDGRLRTNLALFHNEIKDMQREVNLSSPGVAVLQIIRNTADATIRGAELEVVAAVTFDFQLTGNVGYTDGEYDRIRYDISGDGIIDGRDYALRIPRLTKLTWGLGLSWETDMSSTPVTTRINFNHRDDAAYTDNNRGWLNAADMLDASVGVSLMDRRLRLSLFGRNLLDEVTEGNDTQLPNTAAFGGVGATFSPLSKGRVLGVEVNYKL